MDILIFSGQSNMQGSTGAPSASAADGCFEYRFLSDKLVALKSPVGEDIGDGLLLASHNGCGSLVPAFCRAYAKTHGSAVAIHCARGNTRIDEWAEGTDRYRILIEKCRNGIEKTKETHAVGNIFFVWMQGESDALAKTPTQVWLDRLIAFKNAVRRDLGIRRFGIVQTGFFAAYAPWAPDADRRDDLAIMKAQRLAPRVDPDFVLLTTVCRRLSIRPEYLNPQEYGPHYNNEAMEIIGTAAGKALARLR